LRFKEAHPECRIKQRCFEYLKPWYVKNLERSEHLLLHLPCRNGYDKGKLEQYEGPNIWPS
jgi:hypothetical protein